MFKGFNKKFQEQLEINNRDGDSFTFSFMDLELVEVNGTKRKCRIIDEELSKELHKLVLPVSSKPTFVEFNTYTSFYFKDNDIIWPNLSGYFDCIKYWLKEVKKETLKKTKVSRNGILFIDNFTMSKSVKDTTLSYSYVYDNEGEWKCNDPFSPINYGYDKKIKKIHPSRVSAIQSINNAIQNGNISLEELGSEYFFRSDCLCDGNLPPQEEMRYYETHINKCLWRPDRINDFKDNLIDLIQRKITELSNHKTSIIQQIIKKAKEQGITENELNNNRPGWQDTLRKLTNRTAITDYQTKQLEADIKNLVSAKNNKSAQERQRAETEAKEKAKKEEERLKKEREEREEKEAAEKKKKEEETKKQAEEQAKQQELNQKKDNFIIEITTALNSEPQLINSDLSPQYQNWEEQISKITDIQQISNFQDRLLADIQARRQDKKSAQEVKENLKKAQTGTKEEKEQAWENLEKQETEKGYDDNKEEAENLKKEKATENPQEYSEKTKKNIEKKLKDNGIKEGELSDENQKEWQKLKSGEIKDPNQLVETETKIKQNVYQAEAKKKVADLTAQVNKVLKSKEKSQIAAVKKKLLEFLGSSNIYYSDQKKTVENLLTQLENYSATNNNQNNSSNKSPTFPWKLVIPFLLIGIILVALVLIILRKKLTKLRVRRKKLKK